MNKDYTYRLAKYSGKTSRLACPQCERPHCFTPYVDEEGKILSPLVGRCDHESSCGYHYPPKAFFKEHPQQARSNFPISLYKKTQMKPKAICTIPNDYVIRSVRVDIDSDFTLFLKAILSIEAVEFLVQEYQLGVTNSGDVIFFEIDMNSQCRTGKIMKYDRMSGHRIKDSEMPGRINWVHAELKRAGNLPPAWEMTQCLFGEHLLTKYPDKTVALVEAEKTAVICAAFMPEYVWLATGGRSQLNDRVKVLKGRRVVAYPDLDALNEWRERSLRYPEVNITVSSLLEKVATPRAIESKMDIGDWLIEWAKGAAKKL